ncbi:MAG: hypothetical protein ACI4LA_03385 [Emergencia sp.]
MLNNKLKPFAAALLSAALILSWGCGTQTPEQGGAEDPKQTAGATEEELALIGGSLEHVRQQNRLSNLLEASESIHLFSTFSEGDDSQTIFFRFGGKNAWANVILKEDEKRVVCGNVEGMDFYCEPGERVNVTLNVDYYRDFDGSDMENCIADCITEEGMVESVEDLGEYLKVTSCIEAPLETTRHIYVLDKETLHLIEAFYMDADGVKIGGNSIEYNGDDEGIVSNFLTAWEELRTVTFVYERYSIDDQVETDTLSVDVPATWEVTPAYEEQVFLYLNRNMTREYSYPGDGVSYTVYATNVAG